MKQKSADLLLENQAILTELRNTIRELDNSARLTNAKRQAIIHRLYDIADHNYTILHWEGYPR